jgi:hypothetical protein
VQPHRFELVPDVAPSVTVHVEDDRETSHPDEDLIEIGLTMKPQGSIAVTLSLDELVALRDALNRIIERRLDE